MRWNDRVLGPVVPWTAQSARLGLQVDHRRQELVLATSFDILLGTPFDNQRCWMDQAVKPRTEASRVDGIEGDQWAAQDHGCVQIQS